MSGEQSKSDYLKDLLKSGLLDLERENLLAHGRWQGFWAGAVIGFACALIISAPAWSQLLLQVSP